jgi:hypothetical protein
MKFALAVTMAVALAGPAVAEETKGEPCTGVVKQDIEALAKRFVRLGAKGTIIGATCNARGNLSVLTIHRKSDNHITRWKPKDGLTALIDRVMAGE